MELTDRVDVLAADRRDLTDSQACVRGEQHHAPGSPVEPRGQQDVDVLIGDRPRVAAWDLGWGGDQRGIVGSPLRSDQPSMPGPDRSVVGRPRRAGQRWIGQELVDSTAVSSAAFENRRMTLTRSVIVFSDRPRARCQRIQSSSMVAGSGSPFRAAGGT